MKIMGKKESITIDPRHSTVKIVVFWEASSKKFLPQSSNLGGGGRKIWAELQLKSWGNEGDPTPFTELDMS